MNPLRTLLAAIMLLLITPAVHGQPDVLIYGDTVITAQGYIIDVPIRVKRFSGIVHMSTTITWNPAVVSFNNVNSFGLVNLSAASFNTTQTAAGQLLLNWYHPSSFGQAVADTTVIFKLNFTVVGTTGTNSHIRFRDTPMTSMWYYWTGNQGALDTIPGLVNVVCWTPQSSFSATHANHSITFQDNSLPMGTTWLWDFGDGGTSTAQNPTHVYASTGTYTVCLIATNGCGVDTTCQPITVTCPNPVTGFTQASTMLTAAFTDTSTNAPTGWLWDFGDGGTSTLQNPTHTYATAGTYTVCLQATNSCGQSTVCLPMTISCQLPAAAFTSSPSALSVAFNNTSTNSSSWLWDFGDGNASTAENPTHAYALPGTYVACLTSTNPCGDSAVQCDTVTVSCAAPAAQFTSTSTGLSTLFTDGSTGGPTSWLWDFGDGGTSTLQFPVHNYAVEGSYLVCLIASSICGADTFCATVTLVCPVPSAAFGSATTGLVAAFTDLSTNAPTAWSWDFGDGATSTLQNPSHAYAQAGSYTACLRTDNACGSDSTCDSVTVSVVIGIDPGTLQAATCHPNPTTGAMTLTFPAAMGGDVRLTLIDALGRVVWENVVPAAQPAVLDLQAQVAGCYLLRLQDMDGHTVTRLLQRQ
jgi:PKD repeat protein